MNAIVGLICMGAGGAFLWGAGQARRTGILDYGSRGASTRYDRSVDPEKFEKKVREVAMIGYAGLTGGALLLISGLWSILKAVMH